MLLYTGVVLMCVNLEKYKNENIDKIRIGSCLELYLLQDYFLTGFDKVISFLDTNSNLLNNQHLDILRKQIIFNKELFNNTINIISSDIDKEEKFCEYHSNFY